jgi:alcohol dehydrogenase (NADP+)
MPLTRYLSLLKPHGHFIMVGAPKQPLPRIPPHVFIMNNIFLGGSAIGSPANISETLEAAAKEHVHGWVQTRLMKEVNEAVLDM